MKYFNELKKSGLKVALLNSDATEGDNNLTNSLKTAHHHEFSPVGDTGGIIGNHY
jgi:hypothetical protein